MFKIDTKSRIPVYEQLEKLIVKYVSLGVLSPDEQLPSVRTMAQETGINPNTVQKAYRILESHNVIYTLPGRGAFVSGESQSLDKVRLLALSQFRQTVEAVRDTGLKDDELKTIIDDVYRGGKSDD